MYRLCIPRKRETVCSQNVKMVTMHPTPERQVAIFFLCLSIRPQSRPTLAGWGEGG